MATIDQAPPSGVLPGDGPRPNTGPAKRVSPLKGKPRSRRAQAYANVREQAQANPDAGLVIDQDQLLKILNAEKAKWMAEAYANGNNPSAAPVSSRPMTLIDGQRHNTRVTQEEHPGYHFLDVDTSTTDGQKTLSDRMGIVSPTDPTKMMFWKFSDDPNVTYHPAVTRLVCHIEDYYALIEVDRRAAMLKETNGKGDPLRNPSKPTGTLPEIHDTYTIGGVLPA